MLLIYTPNISNRLSYIIAVLFKKEGLLTQDRAQYEAWQGARINYSDTSILADDFQIIPHPLLFENELKYQAVECYHWEGLTAFFKTSTGAISFDIFAASFYLLSRYEEYLPHPVDAFGRYTHTDSVAFKNSFLHLPIVNLWVQELAQIVQKKYIDYQLAEASFMLTPTYDIDVAYCYLHQPIWKRSMNL